MGEEHSSAAISVVAQFVKDLSDIDISFWLSVFISFTNENTELLPFVADYFPTAEASNRDDHMLS